VRSRMRPGSLLGELVVAEKVTRTARSSIAELGEVELCAPFAVGEETELDDLAVPHGGGGDRERLCIDRSPGRIPRGRSTWRRSLRNRWRSSAAQDSASPADEGRMMMRVARAVAVGSALAILVVSAAVAGTPAWVVKANATCRAWQQKSVATFGANPKEPSTVAAMYTFMLKARPIEVGELHALQAIRLARPPGATTALSYVVSDIAALDAAIAAYRAGNQARFLERTIAWQTDRRASRAFKAIGATSCA
jgi:hypothetical protein